MKTLSRRVWAVSTLGVALLLAGCETTHSARRQQPIKPAVDITVVQSSTDRTLTPQDMALLREAVTKFLAGQGLVRNGEYLVRVDFPPDQPGGEGEWMIVKITNVPTPRYSLLPSYSENSPGYFDPYDLRYGSWAEPFYYYDPFGFDREPNYYPPFYPNNRRDHDGKDHRLGGKDDHPTGTHAGNDWKRDGDGWHGRDGKRDGDGKYDGNHGPRTTNNSTKTHDHGSGTIQVARERSGGSSYTPPSRSEGSSHTTSSRSEGSSYSPPARSDSGSTSSSSSGGVSSSSGSRAAATSTNEK